MKEALWHDFFLAIVPITAMVCITILRLATMRDKAEQTRREWIDRVFGGVTDDKKEQ